MVCSTTCAGAVYTAGGHRHAPGLKPFRVSSERLDLSTCVCSHLVCESSDKPITCDTGLINTAVATVHEVVGLCQACGMHLDPTSLNFHCHGTTGHITQSQVFGIESVAGREGFTLAVSQDVSIVVG